MDMQHQPTQFNTTCKSIKQKTLSTQRIILFTLEISPASLHSQLTFLRMILFHFFVLFFFHCSHFIDSDDELNACVSLHRLFLPSLLGCVD